MNFKKMIVFVLLYGKDAIGGVINIVTKTPTDKWHGKVGAEYGSYNFMQGIFNTSGPLVDNKLFLGVNGQCQKDDGWIENTYPGMDSDAHRSEEGRINGSFLYTPTEKFTARFTLSAESIEGSWINGYGMQGGTELSSFNRDDAEEVEFDTDDEVKQESFSQTLQVSYGFESMTLTSTTTHKNSELEGVYDAEFGAEPLWAGLTQFNYFDLDTYTQEMRLASNNETGMRWVGGLYFDYEDREQSPYGGQFPMFDYETYEYLGTYESNSESDTESTTYAAFGQVMIPLADRFELTLGARYQYIDKDFVQDMYYQPLGMSGPAMFSLDTSKDWDVFLPKLALSYRLNDIGETYFYDDSNRAFVKEDAYITLDARAGYQIGNWDFYVYGKNLTDEEYIVNFQSNAMMALVEFGAPLTIGAGLRYRF